MNRIVPLILAVALFMENMDSTVIATSLPAIAADIGTSPIALKLALTAYLVSLAIFIPVSGWMADRYGAKNVFRLAIAVFVVGSLACAASGSLAAFVAARFVQGIGGAMMTPVARLVLVRATAKSDLVNAMAWVSIPALIGPMVGPPVGGFVTTYFTWHWIFLINVPIGIAGILLATLYLPDIARRDGPPLDVAGFALVALAAAGFVFGLSVISLPALPPVVGVVTLVVGVVAALAYWRHQKRAPAPILDFALFRKPVFRSAVVGSSIFRIGIGAQPFLLPLLFQLGFGRTPFESGLLTFASAVGAFLMKFLAQRLLRTLGFRTVLMTAALISGALIAVNTLFTAQTASALIIGTLLLSGFVRSLFFTSGNALVFADIDDNEAGQATAISAATQQITIATGVAVAGGILEAMAFATGSATSPLAFGVAFWVVGLISASAAIPFFLMPKGAGGAVSGHVLRGPAAQGGPPEA